MSEKKDAKTAPLIECEGTFHFAKTDFQEVRDFKCRHDDIWVCSFPRSGTTLTQQTVYLIQTLDFEKASTIPLDDRFPYFELNNEEEFAFYRGPKYVEAKPTNEPRLIKSHLHYFLLPEELKNGKGKIIYIVRNPKSAVLSYYKLEALFKQLEGVSLREYIEKKFLPGRDLYGCPWGLHVSQYWEHKDDNNVLFLQFEKTIYDRPGTIRRIAKFLGKDLTDDDVVRIIDSTTIESMKNNPAVNLVSAAQGFNQNEGFGQFINTGKTSGWKTEIPEDLIKQLDEMIKREIGHTDIIFE